MTNIRPLVILGILLLVPTWAGADTFDHYTNDILVKVPGADGVSKITQLTQDMMVENARALPGHTAAFVVVRTGEGRMCKLLLLPAQQKVAGTAAVPILLIERF